MHILWATHTHTKLLKPAKYYFGENFLAVTLCCMKQLINRGIKLVVHGPDPACGTILSSLPVVHQAPDIVEYGLLQYSRFPETDGRPIGRWLLPEHRPTLPPLHRSMLLPTPEPALQPLYLAPWIQPRMSLTLLL